MKLLSLIPLALVLVGCATAPPSTTGAIEINKPRPTPAVAPPPVEVIDPQCAALAKQARAIAAFRDAGVPEADIGLLLVTPVADFPAGPMIREVYARIDVSPEVGETNSYVVCKKNTYPVVVAALTQADALFKESERKRIQDELAKKRKPANKAPAKPVKK